MAVPKKKNNKVSLRYSILKKRLQKKVKAINLKKFRNNLNKYRRKYYW